MNAEAKITLIGDERIKSIPVRECGESVVDLASAFSELVFDFDRNHVQKESKSISFARKTIGEKLLQAQGLLPNGLRLLIKECHRPMGIQKKFWDGYSEFLRTKFPTWTESEIYQECSKLNAPLEVAPHTTGGAVDLTLIDSNGKVLDMGTEFNASPLSTNQATYTDAKNISQEAKKNRQFLSQVLSEVGFVNYPTEWWHWSYGDKYWAFMTNSTAAIYGSVEIEAPINAVLQPQLETPRTLLEVITERHAKEICELFADQRLHEFVPFEPPTLEQQLERCRRWEKRRSPDGSEIWLNWAAREKESGRIIGHFQAGIKKDNSASIGYVIARASQGKGLATEAMREIFKTLSEKFSVSIVKAWTDSRNVASHRLAQKLGMVHVETIKDADSFKGATSDEYVYAKKIGPQTP